MEYHEVRLVAELRKQGRDAEADELRLRAMRRTKHRTQEHLVASPSPTGPALPLAKRYADGRP